MIDLEGWAEFTVSFFGVDHHWVDHITVNWNALKSESACGCQIVYGELEWCEGYKRIVEARNLRARLEELEANTDGPSDE